MCTNRPEFVEVLYAAQRIGLRSPRSTGTSPAYEAGLHRGELRGQGVRRARRAGRARWPWRPRPAGPASCGSTSAAPAGVRDVRGPRRRRGRRRRRGPGDRHPDALHVRNDRAAQGRAPLQAQRPSALATVNFCGYDEAYETSVDAHLVTGPLYHAAPLAFSVAVPFLYGVPIVVMEHWEPVETLRLDRGARHHPHPHGADDVPPPAGAARGRAGERYDHVVAALRDPRGRTLPGAGQAAPHRVARARSWSSTTRPPRGSAPSWTPPTWLAHPGTVGRPMAPGTGEDRRRGRQRDAARRGRAGLPPGARPPPGSTTTATPRRRPARSGGTTSPSATWATWTTRASCT